MIEFKNDEVKCDSCLCKPVCKEVNNWINYVKEIQELRKKCSLFDDKVKCPYYIGNEDITVSKSTPNVIGDKEQVKDIRSKAYKELIKDSNGKDKYLKESKKEEKQPLDKSKIFYIEPYSDVRGFVDDNGCYKAKKLSDEDVRKVLESILKCGF